MTGVVLNSPCLVPSSVNLTDRGRSVLSSSIEEDSVGEPVLTLWTREGGLLFHSSNALKG